MVGWLAAGREIAGGIAAAVFFALHPVHAEPVQWITGRVDVLTTFFYLAGFTAFLRYRAGLHLENNCWEPQFSAISSRVLAPTAAT